MRLRPFVVLPLVLFLGACAAVTVGHDFDPGKFEAEVQRGVTTQADVRRMLGPPVSTGMVVNTDGSRYTRWLYYFGKGKPMGFKNTVFKMLEVQFDDDKVVQGYDWSAN